MTRLSDKYRLGARIGGGGMAEVFEGVALGAEGFERSVAIKRMLPTLSQDVAFGEMFINEARLAALLNHPNIASVIDFDRDEDGSYFLVMELIQGMDLRKLLGTGLLPCAVSAAICADVLRGLAYAHSLEHGGRHLGLVHRDVSPHNVMVTWDGSSKVVDFGIAKAVAATGASRSGSLKGKIGYMSPEQAHGLDLDGRSDVFAVGVMFHEMLTGQRLFCGATEPEVLARVLSQPIAPPSQVRPGVPADLEVVAVRMLERDRERRYPSADHALEALLGCPSMSARAQIDLAAILRDRFPGEAPKRRADSEPVALAHGSASRHRVTLSMNEQGDPAAAAGASTAAGGTVTGTATATPTPGWTPTAAGERPAVTATAKVPRSSRAAIWIAGALAVGVAAVIVVVAANGGSESGEAPAKSAASLADAGAEVANLVEPAIDGGAALLADRARRDRVDAGASRRHGSRHHADRGHSRVRATEARPARVDAGARTKPVVAIPVPARDAAPAVVAASPDARVEVAAPPPEPGRLRVVVDPWAEIFVDETGHGEAPKTLELPAGEYRLRLRNPELDRDETVTVVVKPGRTTTIRRSWK